MKAAGSYERFNIKSVLNEDQVKIGSVESYAYNGNAPWTLPKFERCQNMKAARSNFGTIA